MGVQPFQELTSLTEYREATKHQHSFPLLPDGRWNVTGCHKFLCCTSPAKMDHAFNCEQK